MARPFLPVYTHEELVNACLNADLTQARKSGLAYYREAFCDELVGLELPCLFGNGVRMVFRFLDIHTLEWSENGSSPRQEYYEAQESSAGNVIGIHFFRRHTVPYEGAYVVFDMDTGYVTWVTMPIGDSSNDKDVHPFPHFGEVESAGKHAGERHHYSNEYVGTIIDWKYDDRFSIRHAYVTPYLTISPEPPNGQDDYEGFAARTFLKAFHVKIRDNLLLTSFVEKGGCAAVLLIDLKRVHDIGCFYGITHEGHLSSVTLAAIGGLAGPGIRDTLVPPMHPI